MKSLLLLFVLVVPSAWCASFRAAAVKVDITPEKPQMLRGYSPRMSTKVLDPLFHRILVLDDGTSRFVLIASDLCSLSPAYCERVTGELARTHGLPTENVWWSITHTHSSPYVGTPGVPGVLMPNRFQFRVDPAYSQQVEQALAEGVRTALAQLQPARVKVGRGYSEANINRRARDADGQVRLGMNPTAAVDRRIGLLRFDRPDGTPLAIAANYAMHATALGGSSTLVSADAPGAVASHVEEQTGAAMLYLNGAAGNLAPLYSGRLETEARLLNRFKVLLGDPILDASRLARPLPEGVRLRSSQIVVETPKRPGLGWSEELAAYRRVEDDGAETLLVPVRFLQVGDDLVLWSAPMELFCEISNAVRDRSPFADTFYIGYTNGTFGYLPTEEEYLAGGYEPATSPFTASAAGHLGEAVVKHLRALREGR
jgi:neutral ceramidase